MKFADEIDRANHIVAEATNEAVEKIQRKARPEQLQNPDGSWPTTTCIDCDNDIEDGRLAIGKVRCFACQDKLELRLKLHAR